MDAQAQQVKVWDLFVRVFHWSLVVSFFVAYLTEDDLLTLHVWAGYLVGGLVVLRLAWGLVGPRHARFTDFVYRPSAVRAYLVDLIGFRAKRYLGHSPAGGAMVVALIVGLALTEWTGLEVYAAEENAGPLAAAVERAPAGPPVILVSRDEGEDHERKGEGRGGGLWGALHETLANLMLILVVLHVAGVALASVVHRENLARAMVTGYKRAE